MYKKRYIIIFLIIIPFTLFSSGERESIRAANKVYMTGDYNQALVLYEEAEVDNPESPHIYLNKGLTYFRLQDYEKAKEAFLSAASKSRDLELEAKAYYNLGNTSFFEAARHTETDLEKAVELYQEAIINYQVALERDENTPDAAHNIEVTRIILRDLLDKLKQQQEQNAEQQEKLKEIAEKLAELIEREHGEIDMTQNLKEEKDSKGVTANVRKNAETAKKEQQAIRKETGEVSKKLEELILQGQQTQGAAQIGIAKEHVDVSANFQHLAENQLAETTLENALESEGKALEELIKALEALVNPQAGQNEQQQQEEEQQQEQTDDAEEILDQEREQRRQRQMQQPEYTEVERDR